MWHTVASTINSAGVIQSIVSKSITKGNFLYEILWMDVIQGYNESIHWEILHDQIILTASRQ